MPRSAFFDRKIGLWIAILCVMTATNAAWGQSGSSARSPATNIAASLVTESAAVPGEQSTLALRFVTSSPEWHGYWSNPGDAGFGMQLDWDLPPGWRAGKPRYPVPERLVIAGLMNYVYDGSYSVLVPVSVPVDAQPGTIVSIAVDATWLACTDEICVPEQARLTATVPIGTTRTGASATSQNARAFAQWRAAIAPKLDSTASFAPRAGALRLAIPLPSEVALNDPYVFVENRDVVAYGSPQVFRRRGDLLLAEIPLANDAVITNDLTGILSFGNGDNEGSGDGVAFRAVRGSVPTGGSEIAPNGKGLSSLWVLMAGALAGGLLLNIMPCVFPILSLKALSLARAGANRSAARRDGIAYTAGVVVSCLALGGLLLILRAGGEQVGWAFQLQVPGFVVALLALAIAITANFAGLFELPSLSVGMAGERTGAFATGVLTALVATPCTGPFMAAALGAALLLPPVQALGLFCALGVGLASPFLLLAFVPALQRMLPVPGRWMVTFRRILAIPMGLTAIALAWLIWQLGGADYAMIAVALALAVLALIVAAARRQMGEAPILPRLLAGVAVLGVAGAMVLPRFEDAAPPVRADTVLAARVFSEAALSEARATGRPVFVWFTADWCLTCKVNERVAIERDATRAAFERSGVIALRGDWTRRDPDITGFLTEQGAAGVPLYLWYPADQHARTLPQVLAHDSLVTLAEGAAPARYRDTRR